MNGPGDIPLTHSSTPDTQPCSLISIIPTLGMSSCRGRAEAFARRLSSKLRTLGSQNDDEPISQEDEPIINGSSANTWLTSHESEQTVTDLQPLRHESDSFFDFDCELESPGSPVDECEYLRLIETASNTPHNSVTESGYGCASAASSHSSSDGPYFDAANTENTVTTQQPSRATLTVAEVPNYVKALKMNGSANNNKQLNGLSEHSEHLENNNEKNFDIKTITQTQANHTTESKHTLPGAVSDVATTSAKAHILAEQQEQQQHHHQEQHEIDDDLSSQKDMIRAQDEIINELQKQSENIGSVSELNNENGHCNNRRETKTETTDEQIALDEPDEETEENAHNIVHTITNGHTEDGEEIIKIEMTEIEKEMKEVTQNEQTDSEQNAQHVQTVDIDQTDEINSKQISSETTTEDTNETNEKENSAQCTAIDITDDEDECRPQRVRRCSSLKTGKTPPGTPGRKKIVRFADVLGLDLADIKTFLDEIPTIPKSAFEDLEIMDSEPPIQLGPKTDKLLMPLFQQPGGLSTFLDMVREKQVSLENAAVTDPINQTITGSVRVRNLDFHKSVHIRYTLDGWRSYADLQSTYVENSCDGFSDKFSFIIFGNSLQIGQRLEFAVRFQCKGQQFWDSNYGTNYCFQCLPTSNPASTNAIQPIVPSHHPNNIVGLLSPTVGDAWCSSFY